ncbi:von Willebrand factor A domain-containing protein 7-like isoform X1 [Macrobrachium rosenbergii]|uniref:von Willebrand factor A domain-containing protein 7-like isoform X1 n=1 Tax=Macrobrachium rosenbergii TaxID=79674 RepID=UPI0034D504B4
MLRATPLMVYILYSVWGPAKGFLGRGTLLEDKGDIFNIYCREFDRSTQVWHHREITREAVRRVIVQYFKEVPPSVGVYNHRDGMTLEEAYREYYGSKASPQPFLYTLGRLVDAAASADSGILGADPRYHFGSERFSESQQQLASRWRRIVQAGLAGDYSAAIYMLGLSLATIQDFYSHTNWIEIGNNEFSPNIGLPGMEFGNVATPSEGTCRDCPLEEDGFESCKDNILQEVIDQMKLTSGYSDGAFVNGVRLEKPRGLGKCSHGGSRDRSGSGINKELPTACFSPHHHLHQEAAEEAIQASEFYLNLVRGAVGDALFSRLLSLHPSPAIVLVLDTTDSMKEELSALTRVVRNLLERHSKATYPPAEYLLVPFNDPYLSRPVTRSQRPDEIYEALTQLRATGGGDEAEYSMSALRLALHYAPSYSHVFLITDASIKDPEVFDSVVAMAKDKRIQVTPVLTMPVSYGGILGRSGLLKYKLSSRDEVYPEKRISVETRAKRQLSSFTKYQELAQMSGGLVIETPSDLVEETSKIFEAEQYPMAVLWREDGVTSPRIVKFPVDSLVSEFEISISGMVDSAALRSPSGIRYDLSLRAKSSDHPEYTVVVITPFLIQVRVNVTQRQSDLGEWTLRIDPSDVVSLAVFARTSMNIVPVFYRPDYGSTQPSLQRILGQPGKDVNTFLDVVVTGVDTAGLRSVTSAHLRSLDGQELIKLDFPTTSPRRNTYLDFPTDKLRAGMFTIVVLGTDSAGYNFRRESGTVWKVAESFMEFPLGREVWGYPGQNLTVPVIVQNTNRNSSNTFFLAVNDAKGTPIALSQPRVTLGRNESVRLNLYMTIPRESLSSTTSTIVVTATSIKGDTSYAVAHLSVSPVNNSRIVKRDARLDRKYQDQVPPTITESGRTSCVGYLSPEDCNHQWSVKFRLEDSYPGLLKVTTTPDYRSIPIFSSGVQTLEVYYSASCCQPRVTIYAYDLAFNVNSLTVDNSDSANLSAGAVSGIVIGSIAAIILLLALVIFIVKRQRGGKTEYVIPRKTRRRHSSE